MAQFRLPGPLCVILGALEIDAGTLCRQTSPLPGPVEHTHSTARRERRRHHRQAKSSAVLVPTDTSSKLDAGDFEAAAQQLGDGIPAALVHAFADVESGGKSGFGPSGRPVIAFEGHIFRKYTHRVYDLDHPFLSYPYRKKAGPEWVHNNKDQDHAWKTLEDAMLLDHEAALKSCSWGMFQVMGFNYSTCGYKTVDAFAAAMKAGEAGQLQAFVAFCKSTAGCLAAMRAKDFKGMAAAYNGNDYGDYDKRIEKAYRKYGG